MDYYKTKMYYLKIIFKLYVKFQNVGLQNGFLIPYRQHGCTLIVRCQLVFWSSISLLAKNMNLKFIALISNLRQYY